MAMPHPRPAHDEPATAPANAIDGRALAGALAAGAAALAEQADAINAINVFPVPDGDTGTNMSMTMRTASAAAGRAASAAAGRATGAGGGHAGPPSVAEVAQAAADAALTGAKGNSGVILSQILAGFAAMPDDAPLDAPALASALERGRDAAYRMVSQPKEGTILTAIAEAARGARRSAASGGDADAALAAAADGAREAVANSPNLLPVLREAGVVDSGAQGLYVLLEGMLHGLRGEAPGVSLEAGHIDESWLAATERTHADDAFGFCTEFVVTGARLDRAAVRERLATMGASVLVVGGDEMLRVHVHAEDPAPIFAYARTLGAVAHEKADDMQAQMASLARRTAAADARPSAPNGTTAVVAIGAGAGIEELLRSIGAAAVVQGGQTMNPSAGEIADAITSTGAAQVVVLPDNRNIMLAVRQAAEVVAKRGIRAEVLPALAVPQGVAALIAMNSESTFDENLASMRSALARVTSAQVTRAVRKTTIDGRAVREGQAIALVDDVLAAVDDDLAAAVRSAVSSMIAGRDAPLVTLYYGDAVDADAAQALAGELRAAFACDVEVVAGGQPHYPYLIGVE
jgi:DAK2 domain fusion protein YloV